MFDVHRLAEFADPAAGRQLTSRMLGNTGKGE
jgi:hypothetical protein